MSPPISSIISSLKVNPASIIAIDPVITPAKPPVTIPNGVAAAPAATPVAPAAKAAP